jgi:TRAP-type C4-dicarboxylate transport system permease small subunit
VSTAPHPASGAVLAGAAAPARPPAGARALLLRADRHATEFAAVAGCTLLAIVCVLGMWQVVSRFVLSQPSSWTEELMRRLLIWAVMLGTVVAFRRGALVSVDLMLRSARGAWLAAVRTIVTVASLAFLAVLVWFGIELAWRVRFQTFASLDLSMAWAYAALPVGALFAMLAVLAQHVDPIHEELENAQ